MTQTALQPVSSAGLARRFLVRGMLVGLVAGLACFVVATLVGESSVAAAISLESGKAAAAGEAAEPEMVSRTVQSTIGLFTATTVYGVAVGAMFALVVLGALGRLGARTVQGTAAMVALAGFVAVFLVPFAKYPANPPAVGQPDTIGRRTALYFAMIALSFALLFLAMRLRRLLASRWGAWNAGGAAALMFVLGAVLVGVLMPVLNEVPDDFPATVLWHFRVATVAIQATLWATLGALFGVLSRQTPEPAAGSRPRP